MRDFLVSLRSLRGLITVPGSMALTLWASSFFVLWLDHYFDDFASQKPYGFFHVDYDTAISVLSTVASAAITTLSLVYSLVLVVFTLAAGNIAPRLLQRFTSDRVNQMTAGLLGGTFLFALTVLHQSDPGFVPAISITVTFFLAAMAVLQLIFFVHSVSRSVTIDQEIAAISHQLEAKLGAIVQADKQGETKLDTHGLGQRKIYADTSGYLAFVDDSGLLDFAKGHEVKIELLVQPGDFLLEGQELARVFGTDIESDADKIDAGLRSHVRLTTWRGEIDHVEYSLNVLLEIALRALSPGVNDTFTAIACVDRLSAALRGPVKHGLRSHTLCDEDGAAFVAIPGMTLASLINMAFHPIRHASANNMLMLQHLADALMRLHSVASDEAKDILKDHATRVIETSKSANPLRLDQDFLEQRLNAILPKA